MTLHHLSNGNRSGQPYWPGGEYFANSFSVIKSDCRWIMAEVANKESKRKN